MSTQTQKKCLVYAFRVKLPLSDLQIWEQCVQEIKQLLRASSAGTALSCSSQKATVSEQEGYTFCK